MRQLYLPSQSGEGSSEVTVSGREYRHIARVLRLGPGDEIDAVDAGGRRRRVRILRLERDSLVLAVAAADPAAPAPAPGPRLELYQCLPKGQKMDIIVRQATEAGVTLVVPVLSARCVPTPSAGREDRWHRIAIEALEQCGRAEPPALGSPLELRDLLGSGSRGAPSPTAPATLCVFFHEDPEGAEPLHAILEAPTDTVRILVGPEGGLAPAEVAELRGAGWRQAYLGPGVLRVETAATAAVSTVSILLLEKDAWIRAP